MAANCSSEDIVISGISGRFPESDDVNEFMANLYLNKDFVTKDERRWPVGFLGLPEGSAKLKDISRFDADFFGISESEANLMDAQLRIMLELTYEAIWDSGNDPNCWNGTNTGTFIGNFSEEVSSAMAQDYTKVVGFQQFFAGRVAQMFDFRGPSMVCDTACASSFTALNEALRSLRSNRCDRAVVVGNNIALNPTRQLTFTSLNMTSEESKCKCLDKDANGYAKGEACVVVVLQKKSETKRIYATVVHTKAGVDGFKEMGITFPSSVSQSKLIRETYAEANINPNQVKYVEAHCTGTQAGDPVEMASIVSAMCTDRKEPLLIGAIKANIGHTEAASGMCSLAKVLFSLENQLIPANIHMKTPNPKIEGLMSGVLKPITVNTPFKGSLVGLNSFGFGGANAHVIVRADSRESSEENNDIFSGIPRLVLMCGPNEESVEHSFDSLSKSRLTRDYLSLVNEVSKTGAFNNRRTGYRSMNYRGFAIKSNKSVSDAFDTSITRAPEKRPQVWYVFSGMGCQWPAMAKSLMSLDVFAQSIKSSAQVLNELGCDLMSILLDENKSLLDSTLNTQISIASVQLALVDVLNELGIRPDGIVGHSAGELICGYADGCITKEEALLIEYWRARLIWDNNSIKGGMAAVGLPLDDLKRRLPPDVFIACHNSDDSFTVSGTESAVNTFAGQLKAENIFAQMVECTGIPFHSPLMSGTGKLVNDKLSQLIPTKRLRSSKWLSTTYPEATEESRYLSANYFTDNMVNPVHFSQAIKQIPRDSVVIEVSPHHLMRSIVKRSLGSDITYIPLMKKNEDNLIFILKSVGQLYCCGINPKIERLYPNVEHPVSRATPALSPMIKWDHKQSFTVYKYPDYFNPAGISDCVFKVDLQDKEDEYLSGHCIDGMVLFPATGYLFLAWKQLAKQLRVSYDELPIEFQEVTFHRATILPKEGVTKFMVKILESSGHFVITESGTVAATGRIFVMETPYKQNDYAQSELNKRNTLVSETEIILQTNDIYKELRLRGYDYGNTFQGLTKAVVSSDRVSAAINWTNWVAFADSFVQTVILGKAARGLYLPVRIDYLRCDPRLLSAQIELAAKTSNKGLPVLFDSHLGMGVAMGMEFRGILTQLASRKPRMALVEQYPFISYDENCSIKKSDKKVLDQYMRQCYGLASNMFGKFDLASQAFLSQGSIGPELKGKLPSTLINTSFGGDTKDSHQLLQILENLNRIEKPAIKVKFVQDLKENLTRLENDLLNVSLRREEVFRHVLQTVIENIKFTNNRIKVLEVTQSKAVFAQSFIQMIRFSSDIHLNYGLLHPNHEELSPDSVNQVECHKWILEKSRLPPGLNNYDMIIYEDRMDLTLLDESVNIKVLFDSLWNSVKDNGFLVVVNKLGLNFAEELLITISDKLQNNCNKNRVTNGLSERKSKLLAEAKGVGFSLVATKIDGISHKNCLVFRKITQDLRVENQTFVELTNDNCGQWIQKLQDQLKSIEGRPETENIWLTNDGSPTNGIIGFINCLRKEKNGHRIRCIFNTEHPGANAKNVELLKSIIKNDLVMNVINAERKVGSFTHLTIDLHKNVVPSERCYLNIQNKGDLSSFKWFEAQHKYWESENKDNKQLIDVHYAPLNFKDVMMATGKLTPGSTDHQEYIPGVEFSGKDQSGNRVMGMVFRPCLAPTVLISNMDIVLPVPKTWTLEEASTVPVVYSTAYYALIIRGKLQPRESVLIHSGSGGVGQAAIAICLSMDCQLFITCGSDEKREFLKKEFSPKLSDKNFWTSRDSSFESFVIQKTNGRGVDVVLNSLSEDKLQASVRCLASNGRFLEIGKYDIMQNNELDLTTLLRNKTFEAIFIETLFVEDKRCSPRIRAYIQQIRQLLENGIKDGTVRPLRRTVFECTQVEEAFRFMASGKHIGKVVLKIRDDTVEKSMVKFEAIPRTVFKANRSYLIIGGLGGFGLELANWMIERGAMNLVLTSRSGLKTPYQKFRIKRFKELGINVEISTKDVSNLTEAQELLKFAAQVGSAQTLGGIFNLALVLSDGLFETQTQEQFESVFVPKSHAVRHLDQLTRETYSELDYFVCFSSVSCGRGNSEQTNYGYANSVMERVCEQRKKDGGPGIAIQWGLVGDVGFVTDKLGGNDIVLAGYSPQRMPSCLVTLDSLLQMEYPVVSSIVWADNQIRDSNDKQDLIKKIGHILGIYDYNNLDPNATLAELGMDSLMSVEVKQILERDSDLVLSMADIRKLSVGHITAIGQK